MEKKRSKLAGWWQVLLPIALFAILTVLVAVSVGASAAQQTGPVYSMEGAWYGIASINGVGDLPSLDTFASDAQRHGVEGTFLCTTPAMNKIPHPSHLGDQNYWLAITPSGHGNWVRIDKNRYAFTAVRAVLDQTGILFGWARFWGTITPISDNEYTGTMNYGFYYLDGTPFPWPLRTGTLHSNRIEITFE
jgi:hypothetical protein